MNMNVFTDIRSGKIGTVDRLRKRLLEVGEGLYSLIDNRSWIPYSRAQIKSALDTDVKLTGVLFGTDRIT